MRKKPNEVLNELSKEDRNLLSDILGVEKRYLHIQEIKNNSREEKEVVSELEKIINKAVPNADWVDKNS